METTFVNVLGKTPISARNCIRCKASSLAKVVRLGSHPDPKDGEESNDAGSKFTESCPLFTKGITCGLTCETMK